MARLLVHVEGETEETFVNEVLAPYLCVRGYTGVGARLIGNARLRSLRGGGRPWSSVRTEIIHHLRADAGCHSTTMVDYYGMPQLGTKAWPGRAAAAGLPFGVKATTVETALLEDVRIALHDHRATARFVPFVIMHEFEGLLFSDCASFGRGIGMPHVVPHLQAVRDGFATPEEINDSPLTSPSKRVEALVPGYQKVLHGNVAALEVGLDVIRAQCPHFGEWLTRLEEVAN